MINLNHILIILLLRSFCFSEYLRNLNEEDEIETNLIDSKRESIEALNLSISHNYIQNWYDITSSDNGKYVYAVANEGLIHRSENYGKTWTISYDHSQSWLSISTSSDGKYTYAAASTFEGVLVRSESHGLHWDTANVPQNIVWLSVSCSGLGKYVFTVSYSALYYTNDYGHTWSPATTVHPSPQFIYVAMSKSGKHVYAATNKAAIYKSSHYGETWVKGDLPNDKEIISLETCHRGKYVFAIGSKNDESVIYKSSDYGSTYFVTYTTKQELWTLAINVNGNVIYAGAGFFLTNEPGDLIISYDRGDTWETKSSAGSHIWNGLSTTISGEIMYGATYGGYIYILS